MFTYHFLSFFSGVLVKLVDNLETGKKPYQRQYAFAMAASYGLLIGFLISRSEFSMLFLGALIAQLIALKIDSSAHKLGFIAAIIAMVFFGLPAFNIIPLLVFLIAAYLDEQEFKGQFRAFSQNRLFLKIAAIPFIFLGNPEYFLGIIAFDLGYLLIYFLPHK